MMKRNANPSITPSAAEQTPEEIFNAIYALDPVLRGLPRIVAYIISLPHRKLREEQVWVKDFGDFSFVVEPLRMFLQGNREGDQYGIPFGPRARLLFAYFFMECADNPALEVDRGGISVSRWFESMGLSIGGKTYAALRDQESRVSSCRFFATFCGHGYEGALWDSLYISGMRGVIGKARGAGVHQRNMARLSDVLFAEIARHPTRIPIEALRELSNQSLGLDIYFWLAYRLPLMTEEVFLSWHDLFRCFGTSYQHIRHFEPRFVEKLEVVLRVYSQAEVALEEGGIRLYPSPPPAL
jgi:hypothetical protein